MVKEKEKKIKTKEKKIKTKEKSKKVKKNSFLKNVIEEKGTLA